MNNRKINYRVWLKPHAWRKEENIGLMTTGLPLGGWNTWWLNLYPSDKTNSLDGEFKLGEDIEVMQYIGIEDKDGKEIYEGDIVKVNHFLFDGSEIEEEWVGKVVYISDNNACGFGFKVVSGDFALAHNGYSSYEEMPPFTMSSIHGLYEESFEVIGNLFENKELLTTPRLEEKL